MNRHNGWTHFEFCRILGDPAAKLGVVDGDGDVRLLCAFASSLFLCVKNSEMAQYSRAIAQN